MQRNFTIRLALRLIFFISIISFTAPISADAFVLGVHPYLSATELTSRFTPLCDYLSAQLGEEVTVKISATFDVLLDETVSGTVDVAFMGSSNYVRLKQRCDQLVLLGKLKGQQPNLRGAIVVRKDSPIMEVSELKGKRMAFVSHNSTMGYGVTTHVLVHAGVYSKDLAAWQFLKNHENVAYAVLAGFFDAGSVKQEILNQACFDELRVLAPLPEVADHLFVAGPSVSKSEAEAFSRALQALDTLGRHDVLQAIRNDVWAIVPVEDREYDGLRDYQRAIIRFEAGP
nr:PhnD/SsuA/transferrin family substrate-binding protein [uncultured Desulfuromonas sp.]